MKVNPKGKVLAVCSFLLFFSANTYAQDSAGSAFNYNVSSLHDSLNIDTAWRRVQDAAVAKVINPDDYVCDLPTDFGVWVGEQVAQIDPTSLFILNSLNTFAWAGDSTLLFDNDESDEYIGVQGEYTREQIKRHKDNKRFWDAPTDDILLMGMHGASIADDSRMIPFINFVFAGFPPDILEYIRVTAQTTIEGGDVDLGPLLFFPAPPPGPIIFSAPGVPSGYDHPLFTLNAFAFTTGGGIIPGIGAVPDKIIMGEGLLEGLDAIGLGTNGPDFVHAHEFAHHVQFEIGAFLPGPPTPEGTRRTELMADAFGAYYSSHASGATFQAKRFADVMTSAFIIGDCQFASNGHHGTPNQREAAALWGENIFDSARKKGQINSAYEMLDLFDASLPDLVAPDAD